MMKFLPIFVIVSGCCSVPVEPPIGLPPCPAPQNITEEIWNDLDLMRDALSNDALLYEECIDRLEGRIRLHDEGL